MVELAALALSIALAAQQPATTAAPAPDQPAATDTTMAPPADATAVPPADMSAMPTEAAPTEEPAVTEGEPAAKTEEVENPYGLGQLWAQGDFVAKGTLIILVIMSLASWYIILTKIWDQ